MESLKELDENSLEFFSNLDKLKEMLYNMNYNILERQGKLMKKLLIITIFITGLIIISGCSDSSIINNQTNNTRGQLIRSELVKSGTENEHKNFVNNLRDDIIYGNYFGGGLRGQAIKESINKLHSDSLITSEIRWYDMVVVHYTSQDANGNPLQLSGLLIIPENISGNGLSVPILAFQHATQLQADKAPSKDWTDPQVLFGITYCLTSGYAVAMADYPGLGDSTTFHPYVHRSISYSVVDIIRVARNYLSGSNSQNAQWNNQLFLMGYSEGGYITMAAAKEIQDNHSNEFTVAAAAPMAGPYYLSGVMRELMLKTLPYGDPYFLPYIILGYRSVYGDQYFGPSFAMKSPYDRILPPLFDGKQDSETINAAMPDVPRDILTDNYIGLLEDTDSELCGLLKQNDLWNWTPAMHMKLFHDPEDDRVPYENSQTAYNQFIQNGAPYVELQNLNHVPIPHKSIHADAALTGFIEGIIYLNNYKNQ
jgi:pimeloyl-ACP methyl ester carboxylesterase